MLEFGIRRGLAMPRVEDRSSEMLQGYALKQQAEHQAALKAKMYADDFDYNNAINSYDNPIIKEKSKAIIQRAGQFVQQNPGWEKDVAKRIEYKNLVHELKDNPDLQRGYQSDAAKKAWDEWRVKNPELANSPEGQQWNQQWSNYLRTGHQLGEEGLKKDGTAKPFMFSPPELFDDEKYIEDRFKALPIRDRVLTSKEFGAQVGAGAKVGDVDINRARLEAASILKDPVAGYRMQAVWKKLTPGEQSFYNGNMVDWIAMRGINHTKKEVHSGTYHWNDGAGGSKGGMYSPFLHDIGNQPKGTITFSNYTDAISPVTDGKLSTASPLRVLTKDESGKDKFINIEGYKGMDLEARNTGKVMVGPNGEILNEVKLKAPMIAELAKGNSPLFKDTSHFWESYNADELNDNDEDPAYADVARLHRDKDGKPSGNVELTAWVPSYTTEASVRKYDDIASGQSNANKAEGSALNIIGNRNQANQNIINSNVQQNNYKSIRVNPSTGEKIGYDGKQWRNIQTGDVLQ